MCIRDSYKSKFRAISTTQMQQRSDALQDGQAPICGGNAHCNLKRNAAEAEESDDDSFEDEDVENSSEDEEDDEDEVQDKYPVKDDEEPSESLLAKVPCEELRPVVRFMMQSRVEILRGIVSEFRKIQRTSVAVVRRNSSRTTKTIVRLRREIDAKDSDLKMYRGMCKTLTFERDEAVRECKRLRAEKTDSEKQK